MAVLHPLECYLLELFSSPEHFFETRDAIIEWIDAHEAAYSRLCSDLDPRQRKKPLWAQGDIVWGSKVLPNIRSGRSSYIDACIKRVNNDPLAFKVGNRMAYNNKGMSDFWSGWMTDGEEEMIFKLGGRATMLDRWLGNTNSASWEEGALTYDMSKTLKKFIKLPQSIPRYELDLEVRIESHERPSVIGIYLPDAKFSAAQLLYPSGDREVVRRARKGISRSEYVSPDTGEKEYSWQDSQYVETGWTLIRRVEGECIEVPSEGFFPRGEPDELYSWPERESQYIRRDAPHISAMSGEMASHTGKWAYTGRNGIEYCNLQQGQYLPERAGKVVKWILILRSDGGSCLE